MTTTPVKEDGVADSPSHSLSYVYRSRDRKISQIVLNFFIAISFNSTHTHTHTHTHTPHETKLMHLSLYLITADFSTPSSPVLWYNPGALSIVGISCILFMHLWKVGSRTIKFSWTELRMVDWLLPREHSLYFLSKIKGKKKSPRFYRIPVQF